MICCAFVITCITMYCVTINESEKRKKSISGMGGSIVMERKRQESLGCPDVKHNHYVTPRQRIFLPTG